MIWLTILTHPALIASNQVPAKNLDCYFKWLAIRQLLIQNLFSLKANPEIVQHYWDLMQLFKNQVTDSGFYTVFPSTDMNSHPFRNRPKIVVFIFAPEFQHVEQN